MAGGRPRTTTPEPPELIELGKELLQWATEEIDPKERPYRFRFAQWYSLKKGILDKEWELMIAKSEFQGYYEAARVALSLRLTDGTIKDSLAHRFLRTYCPDVKREEDETAKYLQSLKLDDLENLSPEYLSKLDQMMSQMRANQSVNKDLTNNNAETKS